MHHKLCTISYADRTTNGLWVQYQVKTLLEIAKHKSLSGQAKNLNDWNAAIETVQMRIQKINLQLMQ